MAVKRQAIVAIKTIPKQIWLAARWSGLHAADSSHPAPTSLKQCPGYGGQTHGVTREVSNFQKLLEGNLPLLTGGHRTSPKQWAITPLSMVGYLLLVRILVRIMVIIGC